MKINPRVLVMREAVGKIVHMLSQRKIRVTQQGTQAYVSSNLKTGELILVNLPYLPDDASDDLLVATQGFLDHEVGHLLYTDFKELHRVAKRRSKELDVLVNIVEDTFVEREMTRAFAGSGSNLTAVRQLIVDHLRADLDSPLAPLIPGQKQAALMVPLFRALAGQQQFVDMLKHYQADVQPVLDKLGPDFPALVQGIKSTVDSVKVAEEFVRRVGEKGTGGKGIPIEDKESKPTKGSGPKQPQPPQPAEDKDEEPGEPQDGAEPGEPGEEQDSKPAEDKGKDKPSKDDDGDDEHEGEGAEDPPGEPDAEAGADATDEKDEDSSDPADKGEGEAGDDDADPPADEGEGAGEPDAGDDDDNDAGEGQDAGDDGEGDDEPAPQPGEAGDGDDDADQATPASDPATDDDGGDSDDEKGSAPPPSSGADPTDVDHEQTLDPEDEAALQDASNEHEDEFEGAPGDASRAIESADDPEPLRDLLKALTTTKGFDELAAEAISRQAISAAEGADYLIWSTDYDKVEPIEVIPDHDTNPHFLDKLKELQERVDHMVAPMQKDVERAVAARSAAVWTSGHRSGRLHGASLARIATNRDDVFRRKQENRTKDVAVEVVVDGSGSMADKIELAATAAYAVCSTLDRLNIVNEAVGFTTRALPHDAARRLQEDLEKLPDREEYSRQSSIYMPILKQFSERMDITVRKRFTMLANFFYHGLRSNIDGESVQLAYRRVMRRRETRKVMIVLSDGYPADTGNNRELAEHLKATVRQIERSGVDVFGIGIQSAAVREFYPKHALLDDIAELPTTVMRQMKDLLVQ
jgi:cobalamin biosynthesis protein CobT